LIFFKFFFINRDVIILIDASTIFSQVEVAGPTRRAKRCIDTKINILESEGTIRQVSESRPNVPVNLTCKLRRNWQMLVSRVYLLDFRITLVQAYQQAVPIEKMVK